MTDTLQQVADDLASHIGEQRQRIKKLEAALKSAQAYVKLWQGDRECNLMPTEGSLATAHAEIRAALKETV